VSAHVHTASDPRVFVFGSNRLGIHGAGAARYATVELGAQRGVGEGPTGRTYALPTCLAPGTPLTLREMTNHVERFLEHARVHSNTRFFVSAVGCGIAGFSENEIAPLFARAPENCDLPPGWRDCVPTPRCLHGRLYLACVECPR
jgi:hypothetical protein